VTDAGNHTTAYRWNIVSLPVSATDALNRTTGFWYDALGRLVEVDYPDATEVQQTYDGNRNCLTREDAYGTTSFSYDALNRLVAVTDRANQTATFGCDPVGNVVRVTDPLNHTVSLAYDAMNRRVRLTKPLGPVETWAYGGKLCLRRLGSADGAERAGAV